MSEDKIREILSGVKKIQGINHNDFDSTIISWIQSAEIDLKSIGIVDTKVKSPDSLIQTAIITYVLSFIDVSNSKLYSDSYALQKDVLRHTTEYITEGE